MFRAGRVSAGDLVEIARRAARSTPTYDDVGATLAGSRPRHFRHAHDEVVLSERGDAFDRAADGLRRWAAHRAAGVAVEPHDPPAEGATVAVAAPLGPITAVGVCRIVGVVDEPDRYGFAYGTLPGHPARGEEAFVVWRHDGRVVFSITAFSTAAALLPRAGGPVTRLVQRRTARRYLSGLAAFVSSTT